MARDSSETLLFGYVKKRRIREYLDRLGTGVMNKLGLLDCSCGMDRLLYARAIGPKRKDFVRTDVFV